MEEIRELYAYNCWANRRILGAAAVLEPEKFVKDMGNSFPSVRDTLVHMLRQLGAETVGTDLIRYYREGADAG